MAYEAEGYAEIVEGVVVQTERGLDIGGLMSRKDMRELAYVVRDWTARMQRHVKGSLLSRDTFNPPNNVYAEMEAARAAVKVDDVVSGVYEITEAFAFEGVKAQCTDEPVADVFNQINADVDLDSVLRRMWKNEYTVSQFVQVVDWTTKTYRPRTMAASTGGDSPDPNADASQSARVRKGRRTRKTYTINVPRKIALLDDACVLPMKRGVLDDEVLLWSATEAEITAYLNRTRDEELDPAQSDFFLGQFEPTPLQVAQINELGFRNPRDLLIMNPKYVTRHTTTKPDFELFADVRLKSVFDILDLKRQLMAQDRVNLVGAANFILLIKKGDKDQAATADELANLRDNYQVMAKLPVIISDHRLSIEIVAPKIDMVLTAEKYDLLDARLLSRLLNTLSIGGRGQRNETNITMSYAVARAMENRRHMIKRHVERTIYREIVLRNPDDFDIENVPSLAFTPAKIALGFDAALTDLMATLYQTGNVSRETMLEFVGLDQGTEALRKEIEERVYGGVFENILMPGQVDPKADNATPANTGSPAVNGGRGGRPLGGGSGPDNPQHVSPKSSATGNKRRGN